MIRRQAFILLLVLTTPGIIAQEISLSLVIYSDEDREPIEDVHIFFANSTIGTVSNRQGKINLTAPSNVFQDLIASHVSYEMAIFSYEEYAHFMKGDSIILNPNGIDPSLIVVKAKRSRKWKKHFKKFRNSLIGEGDAAKECKILNPEVLRFEEYNGNFSARAIDVLRIRNNYLGYDIDFILDELTITEDGSSKYKGRAKFTDHKNKSQFKEILKRRNEAYSGGIRHFFMALIYDDLYEENYEVKVRTYDNGTFTTLMEPVRKDILSLDSLTGNYHIRFPQFLEVTNLNIKEYIDYKSSRTVRGREGQYFGNSVNVATNRAEYAVSHLFKLSPTIIISKDGHIMNPKKVQEYGYWAEQRLAVSLPFDFVYKD